MIDIHDFAKRSSCTETDADIIKEQTTNITRGTQYSKLFEALYNTVVHVNSITVEDTTTTVNATNTKVNVVEDVDITLNVGDVHRKP
jgi:hypothetical protein